MSMIPMLEFSKLPPRKEDKPKRRRRAVVKTPKFPKVRSVAISGPNEIGRSSRESDDREAVFPGAKWVSPQFQDNAGSDGTKKMEKRQLQFGGRNRDHPSRHNQRKKALSLRDRQRENQIFMDKDEATEGSCARARGWRRAPSQEVSTFLSGDTLPTTPISHATTSIRAPLPGLNTSITHHFSPPCIAQLSCVHSPSETTAHTYSCPAECADDPESMVSPVQSECSDDSTYLEDTHETCRNPKVPTAMEGSNRPEEQLVRKNSISSNTESFTDHRPCLSISQNDSQTRDHSVEARDDRHIPDSSTHSSVKIRSRCTFTEELLGDDDETRQCSDDDETRQCSTRIAGNDITRSTRSYYSSDRLSDLVANMSVEEHMSSSSCDRITGVVATKTTEAEASGASSLPDTDSIFSHHPRPSDAADGQSVRQFKPSSFSTPVHCATPYIRTRSRVDGSRVRSDSTSGEEGDMDDSIARLDFTSAHDGEGDDSITRLENITDAARAATPSRSSATYLPASPPKSILKKRSRHSLDQCWDYGDDGRATSKCVTFNLPHSCSISRDSDSVLVSETPLELWRSLQTSANTSHIVTKRQVSTDERNRISQAKQMSVDMEHGSILATETPVEQWRTPHTSTCMTQPAPCNVSHQASSVPGIHGNVSVDEDCVSMLALETPVEQWQSLNTEEGHRLCGEYPEDVWLELNHHKNMGISRTTLAHGTPSQMRRSHCSNNTSSHNSMRQLGTCSQAEGMETSTISFQHASLYLPCGDSLSESEDLRSSRDVLDCGGHASSSPLAAETPYDVWASLNASDLYGDKKLSSIVHCTANTCGCRKDDVDDITAADTMWKTQTQSLNPMCILAMETPLHMWTSPPVKLVDNTFKQ